MRVRSIQLSTLLLVVGFCALALPVCGASGQSPNGSIKSFGITRDLSEAVRSPESTAPGGESIFVEKMEIAIVTDRIEARIGTSFGLQFVVAGLEPGDTVRLRKVVKFPPMHLPDGTISHGYSKDLPIATVPSTGAFNGIQGYSFDEAFELVLGTWTIEIWADRALIATKDFHVVAPGDTTTK